MKGLLLKDWYMTLKYCKVYMLIIGIFAAASAASSVNFTYGFYACVISGLLPVTLLSYDERSKWTVYSCALPYTRRQIVTVKYVVGGFAQLSTLILLGLIHGIGMSLRGSFNLSGFLGYLSLLLFMSCIVCAVNLPFIFKYGVEKGRIWYYAMIGLIFGSVGVFSGIITVADIGSGSDHRVLSGLSPVFILAGAAIYVLSWLLSVRLYSRRELR